MPSAAARRIDQDQLPSFMSVFDLDAETMTDRETVTVVNPKLVEMEPKAPVLANPSQQADLSSGCIPSDQTYGHRNSTSTQASESADSSPTTTFSTTDSSPLSDPSPSSSPDSPLNLIPLNNFRSVTFGAPSNGTTLLSISESSAFDRPMTSPTPRRPRNMKGLSIQPPTVATAIAKSMVSEPSSPAFIKPKIPAMKRKPSLLSLKTSTSDLINKTSLEVPASPGMPPILQRRALKHSVSSPHMLSSLKTSTFGPPGGMTLPKMLERNESGLSEILRPMKSSMKTTFDIPEEESPIKTQLAKRGDYEPYCENENNEDQKSPGYPEGPIAIYGDNVYLYSEPTAEEASRFDVVINVAHEVKNPFDTKLELSKPPSRGQAPQDPAVSSTQSPIPETAVSTASYATAWEFQPPDDKATETPTTPKANPLKMPEYIHIPWDHNTDIAPDLMHLCETIEKRTKDGKKVLVHCQQGASRSASLIIAYGLYQRPELSVNDAYYAAQARSRWISPNMKLMYSLQDFHKDLSQKRGPPSSGAYRPRAGRSPTKHRLTLSADAIAMAPKEPHTAPLPDEKNKGKEGGENESSMRRLGGNPDSAQTISPGPASAPLSFSWRENMEKAPSEHKEPEQKKHKQEEPEQTNADRKEPEQEESKPVPQVSNHLDLPSPFRLQSPPQRPKSAQGRTKPSLAPLGGSSKKLGPSTEMRSHASMGFLNHRFRLQERAPSRLPMGLIPIERTVTISSTYPDDDVPMSPRAETMINPLHGFSEIPGMRFSTANQAPPDDLFSPRHGMFPRDMFFSFGPPGQMVDPRSPPTRGEAPIIRSIDDIL